MENNKEKKRKLLTIIGVVSLIASIIGVTFAYFSATVTSTGSAIGGTTNSSIASSLSLNINKVLTQSVGSNDLVPTDINGTTSDITRAINENCESDGYTGCHLYKITATAYQNMANVNINLESLTTTNTSGKDKWHYSIFTANDNGSGNSIYSNVTLVTGGAGVFDRTTPFDMHNSSLTANTPVVYYLLIWIENDTMNAQNAGDNNDVTGSYTGIVNMQAAGGRVVACFNPNSECSVGGSSSSLPSFILNSNAPLDNVNSTYVTGYYESYTLSNEDKEKLLQFYIDEWNASGRDEALEWYEEGISDGYLVEDVVAYNEANDPDIVPIGVGSPIAGINFKKNASDTNGKGIYIRSGTENNTYPIYYYRGAVDNNNVYFANFCWKIVRTTETGGLKMIYNGAPTGGSCGTGTTSQDNATIANSVFNTNYNDAKYVGYTYDNSGVETDSTIKTAIDTWYQTNILTNFDNYIEDTVYCNDREEATSSERTQLEALLDTTYNATDIIYKPRVRLEITGIPSLNCTNNADKYTKSSLIGNGKLTYPVGLLTSDEIWISGMITSGGNNYLTIANTWWWSLSPSDFSDGDADVRNAHPGYGLGGSNVDNDCGARPALSLKPGQNFEYGNGSGNNPYRFVATVPNG